MGRPKSKIKRERDEGRTRIEIRLDDDLAHEVRELAEKSNISINQLLQGITRWAVRVAHVGEAEVTEHNEIVTHDEPGCLWFGRDTDDDGTPLMPGILYFTLDYSERWAVRDGRELMDLQENEGGEK